MTVKTIEVWPGELSSTAKRLEREWLRATLIQLGVAVSVIDKVESDPTYPLSAWRNYLLDNFQLEVIYDNAKKMVKILKKDPKSGKHITLGEWREPQIVRCKDLSRPSRLIVQHKP